MVVRNDDSGPTGAIVFGCFCAGILMLISLILFIYELFRPDTKVVPAPAPPNSDDSGPTILRNDRFGSVIPGCDEEQFQKSQFLKYYDRTEIYPPNNSVINSLLGLKGIHNLSHPVFISIQNEPEEYNAIKTYTSSLAFGQNTFYNYVNHQLCRDNKTTLKKLMPFIRRATKQIKNNGPSQSCTVYRGMHLDSKQCAFFKTGKVFRFPGFTSTTQSEGIAYSFGSTLFEIHIPAGCHQVRDVADASCYSYEQEWLFSPYSRFKVIGKNQKTIILEALDNIGTF